ncbi:hypothetical protein CR983_00055 [Candidatus Saccharibacteria bacterium]|nr:MAG: hypothetical protein CR983_00055 [Candidatus Saccharibacteria bacterium]
MSHIEKPRIAFLVLAHEQFELLNMFVDQLLTYEQAHVFIHINSNSQESLEHIRNHPRVHIMQNRLTIDWGDFSLSQAIVELLRFAQRTDTYDYFSVHSGSDLAIKPVAQFAALLSSQHKSAYLDCAKLPIAGWGHGGGLERLGLRYPKWMRTRANRYSPIRLARVFYQMAYGKRLIGRSLPRDIDYYGGTAWFTIDHSLASASLRYLDTHPEYYEPFRDSLCGDEIFFNTLFHIVGEASTFAAGTLRHIDWSVRTHEVGSPKTFTIEDADTLYESEAFFARKFSLKVDIEIVNLIAHTDLFWRQERVRAPDLPHYPLTTTVKKYTV